MPRRRRRLSHPPSPCRRRFFSLVPPPRTRRNFYPFSSLIRSFFFVPPLVLFFPSPLLSFSLVSFFFLFPPLPFSIYPFVPARVSLHAEANATNTGLIVNEKSLHFRVQILVPPRRSRASYPLPFQPLLLILLLSSEFSGETLDRWSILLLPRASSLPPNGLWWIIVRRECASSLQPFYLRHDPWLLARYISALPRYYARVFRP